MRNKHQYRFGTSDDDPDEIEGDLGTYYLLFNSSARTKFHKELRKCFKAIAMRNQSDDSSAESDLNEEPDVQSNSDSEDSGPHREIYVPQSPVKKESMAIPKIETPKLSPTAAAPKLEEAIVSPKGKSSREKIEKKKQCSPFEFRSFTRYASFG